MSERVFPRSRVQELEQPFAWVDAHRRFYTNLVRHPTSGDFLVLDPETMDLEAPVLRLPSKAFKGKLTTIDPAKIHSADQWLTEYAKLYSNLLFRPSDNTMLVLNPSTLDVKSPVAKFKQVGTGIDALIGVTSNNEKVRASSEAHLEALQKIRHDAVDVATQTFRDIEQVLLKAVAGWRNASEDGVRTDLLTQIGQLQVDMARLDDQRRHARYPHRYITNISIPRQMTHPETRDESKLELFRTVHMTTNPNDRLIVKDTA